MSREDSEKRLKTNQEMISVILATDAGSTTSKARFFKKLGNEYRFVASGEAPTTVEAPFEDVTMGIRNAIREVEELTGHTLLTERGIITPTQNEKTGVDLYVTTSSAGGGLQMMVAGVVRAMTAESAERAALGAGAIVMDVMAIDDGRRPHQRIQRIRHLRPDMILVAGGTDGGTISHVVEIGELIKAAEPKPRLGISFQLPIVYAGNKDARRYIEDTLGGRFALRTVDNIRPVLEVENVLPAREAVHELFMEHVMSHAPGYGKLMTWTDVPIMPTPAAEGTMFRVVAETYNANVIGVGLGGATTNIYSVFEGKFVRTVSANLGMSYSICNVLKESKIGNILRWVPFEIEDADLRNRLRNKMIRPTTIPQTLQELMIEHAIAREALRLAFEHHRQLARGLRGIQRRRTIADIFEQTMEEETHIEMMKLDFLGGTGGLLSHAPRRAQSALMLIDGFQPEGVTKLAQDSVFMMPHLGVLSTVHPKAALEIFEKDCLVRLGTCIAPVGEARPTGEKTAVKIRIKLSGGETKEDVPFGTIKKIPLKETETVDVEIRPYHNLDVGAGRGRTYTTSISGGVVGIIVDTRGRPLILPENAEERSKNLIAWFRALDAYPQEILTEMQEASGG